MQGADADNLKSFVNDATAFRTQELGKAKPVEVIGLIMRFTDGRIASLDWSSSTVDPLGNVLPPDWIVTVNK